MKYFDNRIKRNPKNAFWPVPIILILTSLITISTAIIQPTKFVGKEKAAIEKLKQAIGNKLTIEYMKSDDYLIKWLKAKDFNHEEALGALEKTLEWRRKVDADNLPFYNFGNVKRSYIIDFETKDLESRPVALIQFQDWDIRRKAIEGKIDDLEKLMDYTEEKIAQLSYNRTKVPSGMLVLDMAGFNLRKHVCAGCIRYYLTFTNHHEKYYPFNLYRFTAINTPAIGNQVLKLVRPLMTKSTQEALRVFGYNKQEWQAYLLETIDPEELPIRFGGKNNRRLKP